MVRGFFFNRCQFVSECGKPYYCYRGYYVQGDDNREFHPIILHFSRDEMVFSYHHRDGRVSRVFSIYLADGELNQALFADKIQNYWHEPKWSSPAGLEDKKDEKGKEKSCFRVAPHLTLESYFTLLLPSEAKKEEKRNRLDKIDFRRIMLDFLFELEFSTTFEDENFFLLQPAIQNSLLLDALSRKCLYLRELNRNKDWRPEKLKERPPKPLRMAEEAWLKVCFQEKYLKVFTAAKSLFGSVEDEVSLAVFKNRIGKRQRSRRQLFHNDDADLRNQLATFFLRRYSIVNAFRALLPVPALILVPLALLAMPFGDLLLSLACAGFHHRAIFPTSSGFQIDLWCRVPLCAYFLPIALVLLIIWVYYREKINLFKLMLPRMFFGIMIGWSVFWTSEELWKAGVTTNARNGVMLSTIILAIILMYVFTDIRNKMIRVSGLVVLRRAAALVGFAMLLSMVIGFYAIQFKARPFLENSGFLRLDNTRVLALDITPRMGRLLNGHMEILAFQKIWGGHNYIELIGGKLRPPLSYLEWGNRRTGRFTLYFIWSVMAAQTMMSILAGIILQLLWEDRPITEPL